MRPVGLFIGNIKNEHTVEIKLDYVVEGYRDFKIARYHYKKNTAIFQEHGLNKVLINSTVYAHVKFLKRVGFKKDETIGTDYYSYKLKI